VKLLILYARSGGGHESAAKAIRNQVHSRYGDTVEVELLDIFSDSPKWVQWTFSQGYVLLVEKLFPIWALLTMLWKVRVFASLSGYLISLHAKKIIQKTIHQFAPDKVISTYIFGAEIANQIFKKNDSPIRTQVIVTEIFKPPSIWFLNKDNQYLVFSSIAKSVALQSQISVQNIHLFDYFFQEYQSNQAKITYIKKELGFITKDSVPSKPLVLIVGGGDSMPGGKAILQAILESQTSFDVAFVCGRNLKLKQSCELILDNFYNIGGVREVKILGFTEYLQELIDQATVVISKAGPATVLETLGHGKPIILSSYIWEQEKGNMEFVVNNQLGFYEPKPKELAKRLEFLLNNPKEIEKLTTNTQNLNLASGIGDLVKYLVEGKRV